MIKQERYALQLLDLESSLGLKTCLKKETEAIQPKALQAKQFYLKLTSKFFLK